MLRPFDLSAAPFPPFTVKNGSFFHFFLFLISQRDSLQENFNSAKNIKDINYKQK
jgi:hypothetical protein